MVGGMAPYPLNLSRDQIEREADRLHLIGDGRDIFVFVLVEVDRFWLETELKRMRDDSARRQAHRQ